MRSVVTSGTGTALAAVPGEVAGKSGTAEYGGGDPPPTHAWFIAFRGDLAIAVLVEKGRSGGSVAAPIAKRFFDALGPEGELSSAAPRGAALRELPHRGKAPRRRPASRRVPARGGRATAERRSCPLLRWDDRRSAARQRAARSPPSVMLFAPGPTRR